MSKIIGIDLGTTNSVVAVVEPMKNLVGDVAKRQMILNPQNTIYSIKRLMGRRFSDEQVKKTQGMVPYEIVAGKDEMAAVKVEGKTFTPQEISAKILAKAKADVEAYLGEKVEKAV